MKQQKGRIDVLFANAGIAEFGPLGSITESLFDKIFNIHVRGLLFTVQKALPLFQDGGSIILTASVAGSKGAEGFSVYSELRILERKLEEIGLGDFNKLRMIVVSLLTLETYGIGVDQIISYYQNQRSFKARNYILQGWPNIIRTT